MEEVLLGIACLFAVVILIQSCKGGGAKSDVFALQQLQGKLDALLKNAGIPYDPGANLPPGVLEALQQGKKIEAIKLYRGATGTGLKEAKDFVEGIGYLHLQRKADALLKSAGIAYAPDTHTPPGVLDAIAQNKMIEAIKLYRQATGVGLKEAKDAVEAIKRGQGN